MIEFITSISYDLWFPELARETKDGPDGRKLGIRCFVGFFFLQNKRGNMKSKQCTALLGCYLWCPPLTIASLRVDISILGNKWNRGRVHVGYPWGLCMLTYNTNKRSGKRISLSRSRFCLKRLKRLRGRMPRNGHHKIKKIIESWTPFNGHSPRRPTYWFVCPGSADTLFLLRGQF